jgi:two-component system LytT family response regulator
MIKIKALLVDDEFGARENLKYLLETFCKQIEVVATATNVDAAIVEINKHNPEVVFLDIEMPQKNGFHLLKSFLSINFQVIFVTAYDNFAVSAFEVSAIDYLLKPIDIKRLISAVEKVTKTLSNETSNERLKLLQENSKELTKIVIPHKNTNIIVNITDIICIEADRMYSIIYTIDHNSYVIAKKLNYYETLLCSGNDYIRTHRSWIVKVSFIQEYSKKLKKLKLKNQIEIPVGATHKEKIQTIFQS